MLPIDIFAGGLVQFEVEAHDQGRNGDVDLCVGEAADG
jgi:hypothetical protein